MQIGRESASGATNGRPSTSPARRSRATSPFRGSLWAERRGADTKQTERRAAKRLPFGFFMLGDSKVEAQLRLRLRKERFGQADGRCAIGKERAGGLAPVVEDEERAADAVQMIGAAAPRPAGF